MVYPRTHAHTRTRARVRGPAPANAGAPTRIHMRSLHARIRTRKHTHNRAHTCERSRPSMSTSSICPTMLVISKILSPVLFPDRITRHANYPTRCLSRPTTLKPAQDANSLHFL